jgi:peptidoglycan/xylan/chitin deacetylase (PgdA/CDA1 family)
VLVTIDDGYRSTLEVAAPRLARAGVPSVLFVCPDRLGTTSAWMPTMADEPLIDADDLRELAEHGMEVGVHGLDHTLLPGLPQHELQRQVVEARDELADLVGYRPRVFAYPEGRWDQAAADAVAAAGYSAGFAVERGASHRWAITRRPVTGLDRLLTFSLKLLPGYEQAWVALDELAWVRRAIGRLAGQRVPGP